MQYHTITADPKPDPHARQQIEAYVENQFPAIFDRTQVEQLARKLEKPVESLRTTEPRRRTSSFVRNGTAAFSITQRTQRAALQTSAVLTPRLTARSKPPHTTSNQDQNSLCSSAETGGFQRQPKNHLISNMQDLKTFKTTQLDQTKPVVAYLHHKLRSQLNIRSDLVNLRQIHSHLPPKLQSAFCELPHHSTVLADLSALNTVFVPVLDHMCRYRSELGLILQQMIESYNLILLSQFQGFYKNENAKELDLQRREQALDEQRHLVLKMKSDLYQQQDMVKAFLMSKELELNELREQLQLEQTQTNELRLTIERTQHSQFDFEQLSVRAPEQHKFQQEQQDYSDGSPQAFSRKMKESDEVLDQYERFVEDRNNNLDNLSKIVTRLLKKGLKTTGTQTDVLADSDSDTAVINDETAAESLHVPDKHSATQLISSQRVLAQENPIQDENDQANLLVQLFDRIQISGTQESEDQWTVPALLVKFLENVLQTDKRPKLLPWQQFKTEIYRVLDHRCHHANELQGLINTSHCTLAEHLLIYLLQHNDTREKAEAKLLQFLACLKYYADKKWRRARLYAVMLGCIQAATNLFQEEWYVYTYSMLQKETFINSKEGYTYITVKQEEQITSQILHFVSPERMSQHMRQVAKSTQKYRQDPNQEHAVECIDVDVLLDLYQQAMATTRQELNDRYAHLVSSRQSGAQPDLNWESILRSSRDFFSHKAVLGFMQMPGAITIGRALLHGYLSGDNSYRVDLPGFQRGCSKFGIDYPIPSINTRLGMYGNTDEAISVLRKAVGGGTSQITGKNQIALQSSNKTQTGEFNETQAPNIDYMKPSALVDVRLLSHKRPIDDFKTPAAQIITQNISVKVKDLELRGVTPRLNQSVTVENVGVDSATRIVIPSFGAVTKIFSQHLDTLRELKLNIELLRQASEKQMDPIMTWGQVGKIIDSLDQACEFLTVPSDIPQESA